MLLATPAHADVYGELAAGGGVSEQYPSIFLGVTGGIGNNRVAFVLAAQWRYPVLAPHGEDGGDTSEQLWRSLASAALRIPTSTGCFGLRAGIGVDVARRVTTGFMRPTLEPFEQTAYYSGGVFEAAVGYFHDFGTVALGTELAANASSYAGAGVDLLVLARFGSR